MAIKITPDEFVAKHATRLKASVDDIRKGLEKVTEAPTLKAAAKKDKMKMRINEAIDTGKWETNLKKVGLDEWKNKAINVGVGRIASGIDAASAKVKDFASQLLSYESSLKDKIDKMPDTTLEDRINRMTTWVREMAKFRKK
jgi:hypothetical protein